MTPSTRNGNISCAQLSIDKRSREGDSFSSRLSQGRDAIFIYAAIPSSSLTRRSRGRGGRGRRVCRWSMASASPFFKSPGNHDEGTLPFLGDSSVPAGGMALIPTARRESPPMTLRLTLSLFLPPHRRQPTFLSTLRSCVVASIALVKMIRHNGLAG